MASGKRKKDRKVLEAEEAKLSPNKKYKYEYNKPLEKFQHSDALTAVKDFLQRCESDGHAEVVSEYFESGKTAQDLVNLLHGNKTVGFIPVLSALHFIVMTVIKDVPAHKSDTEEACKYLLDHFFSEMQDMLSHKGSAKHKKAVLKLFAAMVTLNSKLGRTVLMHIKFTPYMLSTFTKHTRPSETSVRTCFIHFLMSYFIDKNASLISSLLQRKGVIASIITGLIYDDACTVNLVLTTLYENVIMNTSVSKTLKLHTFSTPIILSLLKLYNWEGPGKLKMKSNDMHEEEIVDDGDRKIIVETLHNFLVALCTSHKYGVAFHDKNVGTASKKCNDLLQGVVESMEKPWENDYLSDLTQKILASCPDLVKKVISVLEPYLEPRISEHWMKAVEFAKDIIQKTDPDASIKPYANSLKMPQVISVVHTLAVPKNILHIINEKMFKHKHLLVRHQGTELLSIMLDKFLQYVKTLKSLKLIDESVLQSICSEVMKQMPNPEDILSLWKRALNCKGEDESEFHNMPTVSLHLSSVVDLWLLYNQCFPVTLNVMNSFELLNDIQDLPDSDVAHLQLKVLKLIMALDSSVLIPGNDAFKTALLQLSKFTNHSSQDIVLQSRNIFIELLINSGIFEGVECEVNIWALSCFKVPQNHVKLVMQFLLKAMLDVNKNPNLYANAISQSEESTENDVSKDDSKLEQLLEDLLETQPYVNELQSHATVTRYCYQVTLSPLLPAALKIASSSSQYRENSTVIDFLSCVIIHLIHSHPSPNVLWRLLQNNFDPLPSSISTYIDGWLNKNMIVSVEEILGKNSIEAKLSRNLINGKSSLFTVLNLEYTTEAAEDEELVPVKLKKQTVFVNKASISKADPVHLVLLYKQAVFHLTQMATQDFLQETSKEQCKDALIILLAILQSFDKEQKAQYSANCLKFTFNHPILVSLFRPIHKKKANKIVEIIEELISSVPLSVTESYHLLIPFKQKIVHHIIKFVKKCQRRKISEERNLPTLSLYGLTSPDINLLVDHLVQAPIESLYLYSKEKIQLSTLGQILVQLLDLCVSIHEPLPSHSVTGMAEHLVEMKKLQVADIDLMVNSLYRYLDKFRHNLENIPGYLFYTLLHQETADSSSVQLVTLLFRNKTNLSEFFVSLVRKNRKFRSKSEMLFPLLSALIELLNDSVEESILEKVYTHYCNDIKQGILAPLETAAWLRDYEHTAVLLIEKCMDLNTCVTLCSQMQSGIKMEKSEDVCLKMITAMLCKVNRLSPKRFSANVVLLIVMQLINDLWKRKLSDEKQLENIYLFVKKCAVSNNDGKTFKKWQELKSNNIWLKFVRLMLKYGIQIQKEVLDTEGYLLCTLTEMCSLVYKTDENDNEVLQIFQMALSHSEFLSVILGETSKKKHHLVELLLVLMEKNSSVMMSSHIPIMLGAYHATLGETDQNLLKVLKMYEAAGIPFHNYRPYLWGEAAVNHYSVKSKARFALWRQPKPSQVLDLLDMEYVQQTVKRFPITRDLNGVYSCTDIDGEVYDIAFLLPLFSHLLAPEQFVQTYRFVSCGGLALTLSALASQCELTRKAAYHVLSRFYFHEEASRNTKKRMLCIQFLDSIRLGIANLNDGDVPQLSSIVTTFLARASLIISQANHPLYRQLQSFVIAKPSMNLQIVPEFLTYFHSADVEYKLHRQWILEVLRDGFRSELDMKVCLKSAVFKLLHNFYFSVLADINVRTLILEVIDSAVKVPKVALLLVRDFGLIPQLWHIIRQFPQHSVGKVVNVLHNLWTSLSSEKQKGHNIVWSHPMMLLLFSVLLLKPIVTESELKTYLLTFHAVLSCSNSKFILYLLTLDNMNHLMEFVTKILGPVPECEHMLKYGNRYVIDEKNFKIGVSDENNSVYYLKKILMEWFHKVRNKL